jgi:hypothetical protein
MRGKLPRLILLLGLAGPALAVATPAWAEVPAADAQAIQGVIDAQIAAFARDDGPGAFRFATDGLQQMFGSPEIFMGMVRSGYQPVYRPKSRIFGDAIEAGQQVEQEMPVVGPDGAAYLAVYTMERDEAGNWRIAGCRLERRVAPAS